MENGIKYQGKLNVLHLIEGAKQARGLTVIIDVFRAFSMECYLVSFGAAEIRPVGSVERAKELGKCIPDSILFGERKGVRLDGFAYGNSPSQVEPEAVKGKHVIHTTSAGTQGVVNASGAEEILSGSLVNAKAIARYILQKNPPEVSLVAMGTMGTERNPEDELCADYLRVLLTGGEEEIRRFDIGARAEAIRLHPSGAKFFDPARAEVFPEKDFWMCIKHDIFDFVLQVGEDEDGFIMRRIDV